ncbi:hypothetical protein [Streptomyces gobitricini]|uniref:Uncharacterized protein n=1 Tax=Streptomyces gobitricini TaxID=68211 RepID=A0ABN3LIW1_9ACTN
MWTPHYAVLDEAYWLDADEPACSYCTSLLSCGDRSDQAGEADDRLSAARQGAAGTFTGDTAPAVLAVMITWLVAVTTLSVLLAFSR